MTAPPVVRTGNTRTWKDLAIVLCILVSFAPVAGSLTTCANRDASASAYTDIVKKLSADAQSLPIIIQPPWRDDVYQLLTAAYPERKFAMDLSQQASKPFPSTVVLYDSALGVPRRWPINPIAKSDSVTAALLEGRSSKTLKPNFGERAIRDAEVSIVDDKGGVTACTWDVSTKRHTCPDSPTWIWVGPKAVQVDGEERQCLWAHPVKNGTLRVTFPAESSAAKLRLSTMLKDSATRLPKGAPIEVTVRQEDSELLRFQHPNQVGVRSRSFTAAAGKKFSMNVSTENDGMRHFCFQLEANGEH